MPGRPLPNGAYAASGGVPLILEELHPFEREISVIAARGLDGSVAAYEPAENVHRNGILHRPRRRSRRTSTEARPPRPE
jgi:5-(carboxyamino)imidazole ribonucleotide synthase